MTPQEAIAKTKEAQEKAKKEVAEKLPEYINQNIALISSSADQGYTDTYLRYGRNAQGDGPELIEKLMAEALGDHFSNMGYGVEYHKDSQGTTVGVSVNWRF